MIRRTLHFADVHLESNAVTTESTITGFWSVVLTVEPTTLDAIVIGGDLFDKAMLVPASKIALILKFASDLLEYCDKYNIVLRILEGTPSHDRKQSEIFVTIAAIKNLSHVVSYHPELELVKDPVTGLNILYVPDEINHDNELTLKQAKALLRKHGLEKADYIIMHGSFKYQIGEVLTRPHHLEQPWIDLCNFYIVCGHVHGHSTFGKKILVTGSTNRTAHNEEKVKGAILTTVNMETMTSEWAFLENKHATVFETIDVRGKPIRDIVQLLNDITSPPGSNIRLLLNKSDDALKSFAMLKTVVPTMRLTRKVADEKILKEKEAAKVFDMAAKGISVTYDNLDTLMSQRSLSTDKFSSEVLMDVLTKHVKGCKDGIRSR